MTTETLVVPAIIFIVFILYYPYVIEKEEKRLFTVHQDNFKTYRDQTPKFIPSFSSLEEPEEYIIKPKILRKRLFDSLWLVWMIGVVELIESLHEHGIIPTFFNLY